MLRRLWNYESWAETMSLLSHLKRRESLIELSIAQRVEVVKKIAKGTPRDKAVELASKFMFKEIPEVSSERGKLQPVIGLIRRQIREGQRWQELIDTAGAKEILLIDDHGTFEEHYDYDFRNDEGTEDKNVDIASYDKFLSKDKTILMVAKIVSRGSDLVFAMLKATLHLQLRLVYDLAGLSL